MWTCHYHTHTHSFRLKSGVSKSSPRGLLSSTSEMFPCIPWIWTPPVLNRHSVHFSNMRSMNVLEVSCCCASRRARRRHTAPQLLSGRLLWSAAGSNPGDTRWRSQPDHHQISSQRLCIYTTIIFTWFIIHKILTWAVMWVRFICDRLNACSKLNLLNVYV